MEEDFSALETAMEVANDVFGVKYSKDYKKLVDATALKDKYYEIDERVEEICKEAFKGCDKLEEIVMPKKLKKIDSEAFQGCSSLTKLTLPDSVARIDGLAFCGCSGLTELTLPNSVKSIGDGAFQGCTGLTELTLPNSLTRIGNGAFHYCLIILSLPLNLPIILYVSLAELSSLLRLYEMEYSPDFVSPFTNFIDPAKGINFS